MGPSLSYFVTGDFGILYSRRDNIISLIEGFTIELNPKVRHKLKSIPLDKKNDVYITYLPDASENDILETVDFVSQNNLTPITHLPARTMKDLEHVNSFLSQIRKRTDSKKILLPYRYLEKTFLY